ncbi:hypothetical protein RRG08_029483 [Elysia crispata]|uniref:Uncharacterized protein n=1 Tax=Elysia crispata TaxID=231223 RepID=A0AAE1EAD1_9GAST|nr:hypothetical protein RRG08_029483 [Elysia crispata]
MTICFATSETGECLTPDYIVTECVICEEQTSQKQLTEDRRFAPPLRPQGQSKRVLHGCGPSLVSPESPHSGRLSPGLVKDSRPSRSSIIILFLPPSAWFERCMWDEECLLPVLSWDQYLPEDSSN